MTDLKMMHGENNVLTDDELVIVRGLLKKSRYTCLYIRNEHPHGFKVLNHASNKYGQNTKTSYERS